jgi:hypothetical protein
MYMLNRFIRFVGLVPFALDSTGFEINDVAVDVVVETSLENKDAHEYLTKLHKTPMLVLNM